jgi:UDP-N-acetylmuramoyl-tripeptide--D-alanyl-D-alanine ligase
MIERTIDQLLAVTGGQLQPTGDRHAARTITAVGTDSRALADGALFIALRGEHADGHDYVEAAVHAGAGAVLANRPLPEVEVPVLVVDDTWSALSAIAGDVRRNLELDAVAITGSVGKTTVKDLTAAGLRTQRSVQAAAGSFNNDLGVPLTLLGLEEHHQVLVAEIGARHVGDIARLAPLVAPDISIVTAVAGVHLEIFGSIDAIARAKGELVDALTDGGLAVLHAADPRVAAMAARAPEALGVALDADGAAGTGLAVEVFARDIRLDRRARPRATAVTPWGTTELTVPLAGRHQLLNGLFALAVAGRLGVDLDAAAAGIATATVSPWRGAVEEFAGVVVLDDAYNANPTAVRAALETLVAVERDGRTIAVLGEMAEIGPDAADEHEHIGAHAVTLGVDVLVTVGEVAASIAHGARTRLASGDATGSTPLATGSGPRTADGRPDIVEVADTQAAGELVAEVARAGDVVLVKASRVVGLEALAPQLRARLTGSTEVER